MGVCIWMVASFLNGNRLFFTGEWVCEVGILTDS